MVEFLGMGGYGGYVWSAYGLTALVLIAQIWAAKRRHRALLETIDATGPDSRPR